MMLEGPMQVRHEADDILRRFIMNRTREAMAAAIRTRPERFDYHDAGLEAIARDFSRHMWPASDVSIKVTGGDNMQRRVEMRVSLPWWWE